MPFYDNNIATVLPYILFCNGSWKYYSVGIIPYAAYIIASVFSSSSLYVYYQYYGTSIFFSYKIFCTVYDFKTLSTNL